MYELYYFIHLTGMAVWIGSFFGFAVLIRQMSRAPQLNATHGALMLSMKRFVNVGVLPATLAVLISGVLMILRFDHSALPLYMRLMEQIGGVALILTVLVIGLYSRKITTSITEETNGSRISRIYASMLTISAFLGVLVLLITALRLA
ncbi:hypothetical protein [Salisediminibacterium beveridgei]|uniref:Copper resistance protein D n=1 Tax=Salisediminibacterium beveridgei TaxID=632773 RepID=A0A1D7QYB6_9BACI|nr:hypothetical protein [Salisediminibacterium beveridgei]AOM84000.1 hypothetical protein BBEV_2662 [Salisediminibacterium beveridgei]